MLDEVAAGVMSTVPMEPSKASTYGKHRSRIDKSSMAHTLHAAKNYTRVVVHAAQSQTCTDERACTYVVCKQPIAAPAEQEAEDEAARRAEEEREAAELEQMKQRLNAL